MITARHTILAAFGLVALMTLSACDSIQMRDQPYQRPLTQTDFFADGSSYRVPPTGTVAQGFLREDDHFYTGKVDGVLAETFPIAVTADVIDRGQKEFRTFCAPCHGIGGDGNGMVVQRGFPKHPPSFHEERLRAIAVGHYFDVMTNGFGIMFDYRDRIKPEDRWAIIAYIRTLQISQNAVVADVPQEHLGEVQ